MDEGLRDALNARLEEMQSAADGAERSLQAAVQALREIQTLCEVRVGPNGSSDALETAKQQAAQADVSLEAVAEEIDRVSDVLHSVAGLDDE